MAKLKKGRLSEIVKELQGASKMHLKQSKEIDSHIEDMGTPLEKGLWANIHAKRKRGGPMREKGDEGAPTKEAIKNAQGK